MSSHPDSKSDQNVDLSRYSTLFGRGTRTRKFASKELPEHQDSSTKTSTNSDFIVKSASGLKVLSSLAASAAQKSRDSLEKFAKLVEESIATDEGDGKRGFQGTKFSESDLRSVQDMFIRDVLELEGVDSFSDENLKNMFKSAMASVTRGGTIASSFSNKPKISSRVNRVVPDMDFVDLVLDSKALIDRFSTRIVFTMGVKQLKEGDVKAIRIFRSKKNVPESSRGSRARLSRAGMDELRSFTTRTRNKNFGKEGAFHEMKLIESGVDNALTDMTKVDEFTGKRTGLVADAFSGSFVTKDPERPSKSSDDKDLIALSSYLNVSDVGDIDSSVVNDLKSLRNIQLQNPDLGLLFIPQNVLGRGVINSDSIERLNPQQIRDIRKNASLETSVVVDRVNKSRYKELTIVPLTRLKRKRIGNLVEYSFVDSTVEMGNTYTYYVTSLDAQITESTRSKIVKVTVENNIPPRPPKAMVVKYDGPFVTLSMMSHSEDLVEKFEIYRKEANINRRADDTLKIQTIDGNRGFTVESELRRRIDNGFVQVGESSNSRFGGSTFRDRTAIQGKKYVYRVYSVNVYGNKSQRPKEVVIFVNERSGRINDMRKPTVLSEVDATTKDMKVTIISDDPRAEAFFLGRKNVTLHEKAFTIPTQPSHMKYGDCPSHGCKTFEDTVMRSSDNAWTGYFKNTGEKITFFDKTVRVDNTYQYCVFAVDRFGNKSSCEVTPPLFISIRPIVNAPMNLTALVNDGKVRIVWDDGNLDIDPEDLIGDREVLENTSVRTLFQVERKKVGFEKWDQFDLTDKKSIDDRVSLTGEVAPSFRPPFLEVDSEYLYRVSTFQTGGFISNFSNEIRVGTFIPVSEPSTFRVKTCATKCEPFFIALNWDTPGDSGTVDKWRVERAVINNFAAVRLNVTNTSDIESLEFEHVEDVFKESSRSRARVLDERDRDDSVDVRFRKDSVLSGQHHFIDSDVRFGNTYFYRLTAFGLNEGNSSDPIIRGMKLSDPAFDKKLNATITQAEKNKLSAALVPLMVKNTSLRGYQNVPVTLSIAPVSKVGSKQTATISTSLKLQSKLGAL